MKVIAIVFALPLLLAACGTEEASTTPPATSATPAAPAPTAAASSPAWDEAKARGVDFRAAGEPRWFAEVVEGHQITMVTDNGATQVVTPAPPAVTDAAGRRIYRGETADHQLTLLITETACQDAKSGEASPMAVTASLDGRVYQGCGRVLVGGKSTVGDIDKWIGRKLIRQGQEASAGPNDILERNLPQPYRIFEPNSMGDMMFNPDRLNVVVDSKNVITRVYWG
jgi:uncharacterized membrane protein